jgi:hypothetical protein
MFDVYRKASGNSVLLKFKKEELKIIDAYRDKHRLGTRSNVLRVALENLLKNKKKK